MNKRETDDRDEDERPWEKGELTYLRNAAGKLSAEEIGTALRRSSQAIERKARMHGLPLDFDTASLAWCDKCATWRTGLNARTGWCRVCTLREQLRGREEACAEALAIMDDAQRAVYEKTEAERQTKRLPPCPVKRHIPSAADGEPRTESGRDGGGISALARERAAEDARYLAEMEAWQCRVLKLRYDAAKTRLRRMREKTGLNPRKAKEGETGDTSCIL